MSLLSFPTRAGSQTSPLSPLSTLGGTLTKLMHEWRLWQARRSMEGLSDDLLHDIGLARGEIEDAVRFGRARRR